MRLKIFCGLLLFIFACSKNQWKQPTSICFELALSPSQLLGGDLSLQTGHLSMGNFIFDGVREEGGDVYFSTDYDSPVRVPFKSSTSEPLAFEIPQGVYTEMTVRLGEESKPSVLVVEGEWKDANNDPIFVQIELEEVETLSIPGKNQARQQQPLPLTSDKATANIVLQPHTWIMESQRPLWEMAETVILNGRVTLLVNKKTNVELYRVISELFLDSKPCAFVES